MITSVHMKNFRASEDVTVELDRLTLLVGANGSGKTSVKDAVTLAMTGKIPGFKDKAKDLMRNAREGAKEMEVGFAVSNGLAVTRRFRESSKGSVSQKVKCGTESPSVNGSEDAIRRVLGLNGSSLVWSVGDFYALTPQKRVHKLLALVGDPVEGAKVLDAEEAAKGALNATVASRREKETAVTALTEKLSEVVAPTGVRADLEKDYAETKKLEDDLRTKISDGEKAAIHRRECNSQVQGGDKAKKTVADVKKALLDVGEQLDRGKAEIERRTLLLQEADDTGSLPGIRAAIREAMKMLRKNDGAGAIIMLSIFDKTDEEWDAFQSLMVERRESLTQASEAFNDALNSERKLRYELEVAEGLVECGEKARAKLDAIGAEDNPMDRETLKAASERRELLVNQLQALTERETLDRQKETLSVEVEELRVKEEEQKAAVADAKAGISKLLSTLTDALKERARQVLPSGNLEMEVETGEILWWGKPRQCLSGGERVLFDAALCHALAPEAIPFLDAGECDYQTLGSSLAWLGERFEGQVVVLHWSGAPVPSNAADGWKEEVLG